MSLKEEENYSSQLRGSSFLSPNQSFVAYLSSECVASPALPRLFSIQLSASFCQVQFFPPMQQKQALNLYLYEVIHKEITKFPCSQIDSLMNILAQGPLHVSFHFR